MNESTTRTSILADATAVLNKTGGLTRDSYRQHGKYSDKEIAKHFSSFAAFRASAVPAGSKSAYAGSQNVAEKQPTETREFGKNAGVIACVNKNVHTLEDLIAYMQVDLSVWEVEKHTINKWETVMREPATTIGGSGDSAEISIGKNGERGTLWTRGSNVPMHEPLFQVKAWLVRRQPYVKDLAFERICDRIESLSQIPKKITYPKHEVRTMLEVSLHDAHFGLLSWAKETGENYDLKIAEERYNVAICDLLQKSGGWSPEKIIFPVGNDFFHVNNPEGVTPMNKNVLDVDGRLCKIVESGEAALIKAVSTCLKVAPVEILWIPGNHDPETSYFMCRILRAVFAPNKHVVVDVSPAPRKYVRYGCNLIGFTHGNEERHADLPTIMASEQKHIWGDVSHREWHIGHYHKKKETRYLAGDTFGGVAVKIIPSICGTDAWHFRKGYVGNDRVAEAYLYDYNTGLVGTFTSKDVRPIGLD